MSFFSAAALLLPACNGAPPPDPPPSPAEASVEVRVPHHVREFIFVGELADTPLVVPFSFAAAERGGEIGRTARGWLAHGATWDPFLEESWTTSGAGGVWQILPRPDLRVIAGGGLEVEALVFRRGERALRLQVGAPLSDWSGTGDARYRISSGRLHFRGTSVPGTTLETQRVRQPPPGSGEATGDFDWLFLSDGGSLRLLLAEAMGGAQAREPTFAWATLPEGERSWEQAEIRWLELRPFPDARRDIPVRWSYRIPEAGWEGEVWSLGYAAEVGPERPGRRAIEVRYTVEGWLDVEGTRRRVVGMIRHSQD